MGEEEKRAIVYLQEIEKMHVEQVIKHGESETVEFKSSFQSDAIETLVAFANTKGGLLLIGISDDGKLN